MSVPEHIGVILERVMPKLEELRSSAAEIAIDDSEVLLVRERQQLSSAVDCIHETLVSLKDRL